MTRRSLSLCLLFVLACSEKKPPSVLQIDTQDACSKQPDGVQCVDGLAITCAGGEIENEQDCAAEEQICELGRGCVVCKPFVYQCIDNALYDCSFEGDELTLLETCTGDLQCAPGGCTDLCKDAEESRSYTGCEYWAVFTSNSQLDPVFKPALAVANPNLIDVNVAVSLAGERVAKRKVKAKGVEVIELTFDDSLKGVTDATSRPRFLSLHSSQGADRAYHVVSDAPVTVHQFNPLLFEVDEECEAPRDGEPQDGKCNSYTNDASLLLPVHALESDYIVVSRPSFMVEAQLSATETGWDGFPGFVAVVGVSSEPTLVKVRTRAHTLASADDSLRALLPGDELEVTLAEGEVLQLLSAIPEECPGEMGIFETDRGFISTCNPGEAYDLTGTEIDADGPVQVISGHDCAYVPFDVPACDHLEEALFPLQTWGKQVIVTRPRTLDGEQHVFRVVSGDDDNLVTFDPAVREPVTLQRGEYVEMQTDQHVAVNGKKRLMVAQFLVGQGASRRVGDPAMGLAVPTDQYRSSYVFLSPDTYDDKFVNVIVSDGVEVAVDGTSVTDFEPIGKSGYVVATVRLGDEGEHIVESANSSPVGLIVYGYADFTSYMLPAGLDLRVIGDPF